jgi:PAS domain S-box-containing protein
MEKILIVEDESIVALELQSRLTDLGYSVCGIVVSGPEAINLISEKKPEIILMDINIKGPFDGVETAEKIKGMYDIPIVFLTAFTDSSTLERAKTVQPYGYIVKPFEERELHTTIEIALYKHSMEKKLRDSERRLSATLKNIGDAVIATDGQGKINYMNHAAEKMTSLDCIDAVGNYVLDVMHIFDQEIYDLAHTAIKTAIDTGTMDDFPDNIRISFNDDDIRIVEPNVSLIKDDRMNIDGIVLVLHDITEKSDTKNALVESERKFREVVENASELIFGLDINWKYKYANAAALKISEFSDEELTKINFMDLILPEYRSIAKLKFIRQFLKKEKTTYFEYPFKSKSGKIIWFAQSTNIIIENGKVLGFDAVARDITEKKIS